MARPTKQQVLDWLIEKQWVFTEMTDQQKLEMRKHWYICGAATAVSKYMQPCVFTPMVNGRCIKHGGKTPKGFASPHYKHGKRSRYMPQPMREVFDRAENDRELLSMKRDLSMLESRLDILLKRATAGDADKTWGALKSEMKGLRDGIKKGNSDKVNEHLTNVIYLINRADNEALAWAEVINITELRRKIIDSESKRRIQARLSMTIEDTGWYLRALAEANREVIYLYPGLDQKTAEGLLRRIMETFASKTGRRTTQTKLIGADE